MRSFSAQLRAKRRAKRRNRHLATVVGRRQRQQAAVHAPHSRTGEQGLGERMGTDYRPRSLLSSDPFNTTQSTKPVPISSRKSDPPELFLPNNNSGAHEDDGANEEATGDTHITAYDIAPWNFYDCGPWHAALTLPRREKALARYLHAAGLPFYLPYKRSLTLDRHYITVPLFPGVVFIGSGDAGLNFARYDLPTRTVYQQLRTSDQYRLSAELAALAQEPVETRQVRCAQVANRSGSPTKHDLALLLKVKAKQQLHELESPSLAGAEVFVRLGGNNRNHSNRNPDRYGTHGRNSDPFLLTGRVSQECATLLRTGSKVRPKVAIDIQILGQTVLVELSPDQLELVKG